MQYMPQNAFSGYRNPFQVELNLSNSHNPLQVEPKFE